MRACMAKMSETCDVRVSFTISTKRDENALIGDSKRWYLFHQDRVSKGKRGELDGIVANRELAISSRRHVQYQFGDLYSKQRSTFS